MAPQRVKAGSGPLAEAARLQRQEHYHERRMVHRIDGDVYMPAFRPMRPELVRLNRRAVAKRRRQRLMERLAFWRWLRSDWDWLP